MKHGGPLFPYQAARIAALVAAIYKNSANLGKAGKDKPVCKSLL